MKSFPLIFTYLISFSNAIFYDCSDNHVKTVPLNTPTFFTTSDFPLYMSVDNYLNCSLTIVLKATDYNVDVGLIVSESSSLIYDILIRESDFNLNTFSSNQFIMKDLYHLNPTVYMYIAQQGFLVFENTENTCPLESFARAKPFKFSNINEVIFINADYQGKSKKGNMTCLWRFTAPFGYGFKIVIQAAPSSGFVVKNSTDVILNTRSIVLSKPIYNSDSYIEISLKKGELWVENEDDLFWAYVSIVEQNKNKITDQCSIITKDPLNVEWTNMHKPFQTYGDNTICKYTFEILPDTIVKLEVIAFDLEERTDFLWYYIDDDKQSAIYIFKGFKDLEFGLNKNVTFMFESDGSIQYGGFSINFETICIH